MYGLLASVSAVYLTRRFRSPGRATGLAVDGGIAEAHKLQAGKRRQDAHFVRMYRQSKTPKLTGSSVVLDQSPLIFKVRRTTSSAWMFWSTKLVAAVNIFLL